VLLNSTWFLASPVHADDTVFLTWHPSTAMDLDGYKIYMSTKSGEYGAPFADIDKKETTYEVIVKATKDTEYFFVVRAYNKAGTLSPPSNEASKTIKGIPAIAAVS
jgi:hypothetical protein